MFGWTLGLTGRAREVPAKIGADLVPTMVNGWKFWVPVAAANFYAVPLESRVLFMSAAGVVWTAYLSHSSAAPTNPSWPHSAARDVTSGWPFKSSTTFST